MNFLKPVLVIGGWAMCWEIALKRMSLDIANDEPDGTKPWPEPMLHQIYVTIWRN